MKVRTEHIKEAVREFSFNEPAESFPVLAAMMAAGECRFTGSVQVALTAERELDHYRVEGTVSVPVQLDCSRCLCSFDRTVFSRFTIFFREGAAVNHEEEDEVELEERDLISSSFSGDEIDLMPEIAEQVALEIPLKPLCSESCKGLCPVCGIDLNSGTCSCVSEQKQSRFAVLKDFKVRP
ncbi:DUF177 domain-containing protein [Trichlorobacter lovleyi]|uniref:YceD family protein n=1 Tax=Trichlorobacter lovleyi TaxID=313985 RepID=UPI00223FA60A|nr:DUF177 domain-containing protein [Trichlorobacter lovleyi]QOX79012.1 DUF177 domain-containing protein [Trichlorobacter lovleyi]